MEASRWSIDCWALTFSKNRTAENASFGEFSSTSTGSPCGICLIVDSQGPFRHRGPADTYQHRVFDSSEKPVRSTRTHRKGLFPAVLALLLFAVPSAVGQSTDASRNARAPLGTATRTESLSPAFVTGVDVSFLPELEANGAVFSDSGQVDDALVILSTNGINTARIRLWHTPDPDVSGLAEVTALAVRADVLGMGVHLDIHYSDWWADPAHQRTPDAWTTLDFTTLVDSVYQYSRHVTETFVAAGVVPTAVQLGNEIISGMLWDYGRVGTGFDTPQQWDRLVQILQAAKDGVTDGLGGATTKFIIHTDRGGNLYGAQYFYSNLINRGFTFDIIGLSYYPWWHGTLTDLSTTLNGLATTFGLPIMVVEAAYPWTLGYDDNTTNLVGSTSQLHTGYPATPAGQQSFMEAVLLAVKSTSSGLGRGVIYWAGDYTSSGNLGSFWENVALFDFSGELLPAIAAFREAVLPIEETSITAILDGSSVVLKWKVIPSPDLREVQLEASTDGRFDSVAILDPTAGGEYSYRVDNPAPGRHSFRVRYVLSDGTATVGKTLEVDVPRSGLELVSNLHPNPFRAKASLTVRVNEGQNVRVDLYSIDGRRLYRAFDGFIGPFEEADVELDGSRLPTGVYFVVATGSKFIETRRVVKD